MGLKEAIHSVSIHVRTSSGTGPFACLYIIDYILIADTVG